MATAKKKKTGIYRKPVFALKQTREQNFRCFYCNCQLRSHKEVPDGHPQLATRDHYVPRCRGGKNGSNIVVACFKCNGTKGAMSAEKFIKYLEILNECA